MLKKKSQTEIRVKNIIKRKGDKLYVKWKGCDNFFNSWIDKKELLNNVLLNKVLLNPLYKMSQYFPKLYDRFNENVKVELDLSN